MTMSRISTRVLDMDSPEFRKHIEERNRLVNERELQRQKAAAEFRDLEAVRNAAAVKAAEDAKFARCGVPAAFLRKTLDDVLPIDPTVSTAVSIARRYIRKFDEAKTLGAGFVFYGRPGTGKTMTACSLMQELMAKDIDCQYIALWDLLRIVKVANTFGGDEKQLDRLCRVTLLVLDEVGVQSGTQFEENLLMQVIDSRVRDMLPTIVITNLAPSSSDEDKQQTLQKKLGFRLFDRICDRCWFIPFRGPSQRKGLPPIEQVLGD